MCGEHRPFRAPSPRSTATVFDWLIDGLIAGFAAYGQAFGCGYAGEDHAVEPAPGVTRDQAATVIRFPHREPRRRGAPRSARDSAAGEGA